MLLSIKLLSPWDEGCSGSRREAIELLDPGKFKSLFG